MHAADHAELSPTLSHTAMKISVIIPAYNEKAFIEEILRRVQNAPFDKEMVIVDDCSTRFEGGRPSTILASRELGYITE
ncbi:MAG TPA: glycosyltransferase [Candidatus Acidoferrum sp.]|nr:glycosyltransferase [Candidatus Acidoferrum sp.]